MTDITELAQSMKAAANKAKQANDLYLEGKITLSECVVETKDYLDYSDNPNNILAMVEALEKAQQYAKDRDEENQDLMLTVGRLRTERESLEFICNSAGKVQREFADELGCASDNESILQAIDGLKQLADNQSQVLYELDTTLCGMLPNGCQYLDPPDGGSVTPLEQLQRMVADYRNRIAELERERDVWQATALALRDEWRAEAVKGLTVQGD